MESQIRTLKYCYNCGEELNEQVREGRKRMLCLQCGTVNYQNPIPSVAVIITDEKGELLLTKRGVEPGKGLWCLPGGFIEMGETPEETIVREVLEETGFKVAPGAIIDACAKINGYHGDVIILGYKAEIIGGYLKSGDDAEEVAFFNLNHLPKIAFRCHRYFIEKVFDIRLIEEHNFSYLN
jgi:ADP-ribose pyrophosphatase YjhB (NUDIX family)